MIYIQSTYGEGDIDNPIEILPYGKSKVILKDSCVYDDIFPMFHIENKYWKIWNGLEGGELIFETCDSQGNNFDLIWIEGKYSGSIGIQFGPVTIRNTFSTNYPLLKIVGQTVDGVVIDGVKFENKPINDFWTRIFIDVYDLHNSVGVFGNNKRLTIINCQFLEVENTGIRFSEAYYMTIEKNGNSSS